MNKNCNRLHSIYRGISYILVVVLLCGLFPTTAEAATTAHRAVITSAVAEMIDDYAASVYQKNADDVAFRAFFKHGLYGGGKSITLKKSDAMVSALFNSCVMREALVEGITAGICVMQDQKMPEIYCKGGPQWHNFYYGYRYESYEGDCYDENRYMDIIVFSKDTYGDKYYTGPTNENDDVMKLLVGGLSANLVIRRQTVKEDTAVYDIEVQIDDVFDFNGDYESIKESGYDTSEDDMMNNLGFLLTYMGLDEFSWKYNVKFTIELPYYCIHEAPNYHLVYDAEQGSLTADTTEGFQPVEITRRERIDPETGAAENYFELEKQIILRHDANWIMEYERSMEGYLILNRENRSGDSELYMFQGRIPTMVYDVRIPILDKNNEIIGYEPTVMYFTGVTAKDLPINKDKVYRFRMENRVKEDGSNMIYLSVTDCESGEVILEPSPMSRTWIRVHLAPGETPLGDDTTVVSGRDLLFRFVGNKDYAITQKHLEIRVYEDLDGQSSRSKIVVKNTEPTCTQQGGVVYTCTDCGYSYMTDAVPALGHSYGEYSYDNNATCTADGTKTRTCTVCGEKETVSASDTATGHDYKAKVTPPTYTEQGYTTYTCTVCGDSYKDDYTDVKEHQYEAVVTAPTCTEQGYTTYTCTECGDSYVDDYTELAEHTVVIDPAVAPTCVEKGKTEGSHCGVCGLVLKKQAAISVSRNHRMEESVIKVPTYDEAGQVAYICKDCGKTDYMEVPPLNKPERKNPFTDVMESDWFYEPVLWAVENKVTGGKTETTFAPNEGCTRAQVVTFLWAANGKPAPVSMENPFTDVSDSDWYYNAVLWAVEQGITGGISATEFGPEQTCTRAQIVTFLYAAANKPAVSGSNVFADVDDAAWYATPIIWAAENDVTGGIGDGKFGPEQTCTRAQVVTFLKKVYG